MKKHVIVRDFNRNSGFGFNPTTTPIDSSRRLVADQITEVASRAAEVTLTTNHISHRLMGEYVRFVQAEHTIRQDRLGRADLKVVHLSKPHFLYSFNAMYRWKLGLAATLFEAEWYRGRKFEKDIWLWRPLTDVALSRCSTDVLKIYILPALQDVANLRVS